MGCSGSKSGAGVEDPKPATEGGEAQQTADSSKQNGSVEQNGTSGKTEKFLKICKKSCKIFQKLL